MFTTYKAQSLCSTELWCSSCVEGWKTLLKMPHSKNTHSRHMVICSLTQRCGSFRAWEHVSSERIITPHNSWHNEINGSWPCWVTELMDCPGKSHFRVGFILTFFTVPHLRRETNGQQAALSRSDTDGFIMRNGWKTAAGPKSDPATPWRPWTS